jgi:hypothetical protein
MRPRVSAPRSERTASFCWKGRVGFVLAFMCGSWVLRRAPGLARCPLTSRIGCRCWHRQPMLFQLESAAGPAGSSLAQSNVLRRNLHPILAGMGLEKAGFHSFRRFRVTHLRKQGTPEDLLRFWIGHGDRTVTDRYAKLRQDVQFRKAVAEQVGIGFDPIVPQMLELFPRNPGSDDRQSVVM